MEEEKKQKELFELDKPKRLFPRLSSILPKADFERNILVTLSLDKVVFISIGIIMLFVVVYALGVEAGRSRAIAKAVSRKTVKTPDATVRYIKTGIQKPGSRQMPAQKTTQGLSKSYTILIGSFAKKENAQNVVNRLKRDGFNVSVKMNGPYFQVSAGVFSEKALGDAQAELARIKRIYNEAYITAS